MSCVSASHCVSASQPLLGLGWARDNRGKGFWGPYAKSVRQALDVSRYHPTHRMLMRNAAGHAIEDLFRAILDLPVVVER